MMRAGLRDALGEEHLPGMLLEFPNAAAEALHNIATAFRSNNL
jgi:hypothetical protein